MKSNRRHFLAALPFLGFSLGSFFWNSKNILLPAANILPIKTSPENTESLLSSEQNALNLHPLQFKNGKFKIFQFTDLHLEYASEDGVQNAEKTLESVKKLVEEEKPDLVIYTGDVVTSNATKLTGGTKEAWTRATAVFEELKQPFAVAFGNHDHERKESVNQIFEWIAENPWNRASNADTSLPGAGNCFIPIFGSSDPVSDGEKNFDDSKSSQSENIQNSIPKWNLLLFDSLAYPPKGYGSYDWIKNSQIQWYRSESKRFTELNGGVPIPAVAFFHIPLPEYNIIKEQKEKIGVANEPVCSPELNSGLFTAFVEMGDVRGMFTGHDHINNYIGQYKNISLAYGQKTGYSSYGNLEKGGRVVILDEKSGLFETYIRVENDAEKHFLFPVK